MLEASPHKAVRVGDIAKEAGISRQALYLHYPTRAELLIATARYIDEVKNIDERLAASRAATGINRLDAFIEAWGGYIPEIYGIGRAFMAMMDTDEAARAAWGDRMQAVRHGCAAAIRALKEAGALNPDYSETAATDILWTLLSVRNWEQLTIDCGWSQADYVEGTKRLARAALLQPSGRKD
nr:hypothetical protein GCM10011355_03610 [Aquisalinus luteolus]